MNFIQFLKLRILLLSSEIIPDIPCHTRSGIEIKIGVKCDKRRNKTHEVGVTGKTLGLLR